MMYIRYPLSLRQVEDLLFERGVDISYETVRYWWNRFVPPFAAQIRKKRTQHTPNHSNWRWHLDEVFVGIGGEIRYLWRAVDHEGEVLGVVVTMKRDREAVLRLVKCLMKKYDRFVSVVTDMLQSSVNHETACWMNNRAENCHQVFRRRDRAMCRFRNAASLQKLVSVRGQVQNNFNAERYLIDQCTYRCFRSAALVEWQSLAARKPNKPTKVSVCCGWSNNAQSRFLGISGGIFFVPPSPLIGERAKAPGTAGFGRSLERTRLRCIP